MPNDYYASTHTHAHTHIPFEKYVFRLIRFGFTNLDFTLITETKLNDEGKNK